MALLIVAILALAAPLGVAERNESLLLSQRSSGFEERYPSTAVGRHISALLLKRHGRRRAEHEESKPISDYTMMFWAIGISITILGQTIMVPGLLMMKRAHMGIAVETDAYSPSQSGRQRADSADSALDELTSARPYWKEWWWIVGGILYIGGQILCWIGFGMAPQSICACLQSWNIVVAMFLSPIMLNEKRPRNAGIYCGLLIAGCVFVVIFGPRPYNSYDGETLGVIADDILRPVLLLPLGVLAGMYILVAMAKTQDLHVPLATVYVMCSAGCAWYSASLSKSAAMLVLTSLLTGNLHISIETVEFGIIVVSFVVMAAGQIHLFNMALKHADAIAIVPMYEGLSMVGQIVFGGLLWHEFHGESWRCFLGFLVGVACVISGLTLLTHASLENGAFNDAPREQEELIADSAKKASAAKGSYTMCLVENAEMRRQHTV